MFQMSSGPGQMLHNDFGFTSTTPCNRGSNLRIFTKFKPMLRTACSCNNDHLQVVGTYYYILCIPCILYQPDYARGESVAASVTLVYKEACVCVCVCA